MQAAELKRLRELEAENAKLKRLYADPAPDNAGDQGGPEPKAVASSAKCEAVRIMSEEMELPVSRGCSAARLSRAAYYRPVQDRGVRDSEVIAALNELVAKEQCWGLWKCHDRLRQIGRPGNHKRMHRVYCEMGLNQKRRTKRKLPKRDRQPLRIFDRINAVWAIDFMHDALYGGRIFRTLMVIDEADRGGLGIDVAVGRPGARVIRFLDQLIEVHGKPAAIHCDNGPELTSHAFTDWSVARAIEMRYIQPGTPDQNAFIERFNRSHRKEVLNANLFESIADVQAITGDWLRRYNEIRPHDALGSLPPARYRANLLAAESTLELST